MCPPRFVDARARAASTRTRRMIVAETARKWARSCQSIVRASTRRTNAWCTSEVGSPRPPARSLRTYLPCKPSQLVVHEWCQALERSGIAAAPSLEQRGYVGRRHGPRHGLVEAVPFVGRAPAPILRFPQYCAKVVEEFRRCSCRSVFSLSVKGTGRAASARHE